MERSRGDPKRARSISRGLRKGRSASELLIEARSLKDPYYASIALAELAARSDLGERDLFKVLDLALEKAASVEVEWRRGELLSELLRTGSKAKDAGFRSAMTVGVLEIFKRFPPGHGLTEGITGSSKHARREALIPLLSIALGNKGSELESGKAVLKAAVRAFDPDDRGSLEQMLDVLRKVTDPSLKVMLLSYLSFQLKETGMDDAAKMTFHEALQLLEGLDEERILHAYNDLARKSFSLDQLGALKERASLEKDPFLKAKMLSVCSDSIDRLGDRKAAAMILSEGLAVADELDGPRRAELLASYSKAFGRLGDLERSDGLRKASLALAAPDPEVSRKVDRIFGIERKGMDGKPSGRTDVAATTMKDRGRHILALYDTYEGRLGPVHFRAISKAAPLCFAFSLDLALLGFPTDDLKRLTDLSLKETSIGEEGRYIKTLQDEGRIKLVACTEREPPGDWNELGMPVATTPRPDRGKSVGMDEAVRKAREHPSGRVCLLMGLGKRGLPASVLKASKYHLELTGRGVPLETSTAMGIMAYMLHESEKGNAPGTITSPARGTPSSEGRSNSPSAWPSGEEGRRRRERRPEARKAAWGRKRGRGTPPRR